MALANKQHWAQGSRVGGILSLAFACLLSFPAYSDSVTPMILQDTATGSFPLIDHAEILRGEKAGELEFEQVLALQDIDNNRWADLGSVNTTNLELEHIWVRTRIENKSPGVFDGIFLIAQPGVIRAEVAIVSDGALTQYHHLGNAYPFEQRPLNNRNYGVPFRLAPGESADIYLRSQGYFYLPLIFVYDQYSFYYAERLILMIDWLYLGMSLLISLLSLLAAIIVRKHIYLFFLVFNTSMLAFVFSYEGYAYQLLFPDNPWLAQRSNPLLLMVSFIAGIVFSAYFLQFPERLKHGKRLITAMVAPLLAVALLVVSMPISSSLLPSIIAAPYGIACLVGLWVYALCRVKTGDVNARIYALCGLLYIIPLSLEAVSFVAADTRYLSPVGHFRWGEIVLAISLFASLLYITRRQAIEKEKALAESEARSIFLAQVSHEIRTPMNGILGISELLGGTELDKLQKNYVGLITNSCQKLLRVVNDILDFSKFSSSNVELEHLPVSLSELVSTSVQLFTQEAIEKGIDIVTRIDHQLPDEILTDPTRLQQILNNLVSNAIKFTASGEVSIRLTATKDPNTFWLRVEDTGIGIEPAKLETIFTEFRQADISTTRQYGGTGLGLSICQRLVALMGGRIEVRSTPGKGSTFSVRLSLAGSKAKGITDNSPKASLLLCGFTPNLVASARYDLTPMGAQITSVNHCSEIPEPTDGTGDVVLIAVNDEQILQDPAFRALTAHWQDQLWIFTSQLPMVDILRNTLPGQAVFYAPPLSAELVSVMANVLANHLQGDPISSPPPLADRRLILLAEDNPINQQVVKGMLAKMGFSCKVFNNGQLLVDALENAPANEISGLGAILLDLEMPVMDGFATVERLRAMQSQGSMPDIPVIAVTAHAITQEQSNCEQAGFNDIVIKPFTLAQLENALLSVLAADPVC